MSSMCTTTPGTLINRSLSALWKNSEDEERPIESLLKQKRPHGVRKVVSKRHSGCSFTCQKESLQSNLLKILAPANLAIVSSTEGSLALGTGTSAAHHSVGS